VDATSWTVTAVIRDPAFQEPHGVVLTPDSRTVYVSSHGRVLGERAGHAAAGHDMDSPRANGSLAVIDAATGTVRRVTEVGPYAAALGLSGGN
jgi:DNA-binding beta-propeller fold protein YncE